MHLDKGKFSAKKLEEILEWSHRKEEAKLLLKLDGIYSLWMNIDNDEILLYIGESDRFLDRLSNHMRLSDDSLISPISGYLTKFGRKLKFELNIDNNLNSFAGKREFLGGYCFWRLCPLKERQSNGFFYDENDMKKWRESKKKRYNRRKTKEDMAIKRLKPVFRWGGVHLDLSARRLLKQRFYKK